MVRIDFPSDLRGFLTVDLEDESPVMPGDRQSGHLEDEPLEIWFALAEPVEVLHVLKVAMLGLLCARRSALPERYVCPIPASTKARSASV
jgi:hypothetical protein